jgi:hypothetical protein
MAQSNSKAIVTLFKGLEWVYERAVDGAPGLDSAGALAESYRRQFASSEEAIDALIRWQIAKAAAAGFITNIGGLATLPVALPANLVSALYIQIRMVAAIAALRGHDIRSDQVRTFVLACLCGTSVIDILKEVGIGIGAGVVQQAATRLSTDALRRLKHAASVSVLGKSGGTASFNAARWTPLIGGLVAGTMDGAVTRTYATTAKRLFTPVAPIIDAAD